MNTQPEWALNAAMELFPNGSPNTHYAYSTREENERAKQEFRNAIAAIIAKHAPEPNERLVRAAEVRSALENLYALVKGECPSLLENDHHDEMVRAALSETQTEEGV